MMQEHPWFKEEAVPAEALRTELMRRKVQVDEEKRKEREEKARSAGKDQLQEGDFDPFDIPRTRSVQLSFLSDVSGDEACAPLYPKSSVAVYTSFQSARPPAEVQARVEAALEDSSARLATRKCRFKTKVSMPTEDVGFTVRIFSLPNVSPGVVQS